jgi:hypothetical protein
MRFPVCSVLESLALVPCGFQDITSTFTRVDPDEQVGHIVH